MGSSTSTTPKFERFFVLYNPKSTKAAAIAVRLNDLRKIAQTLEIPIDICETSGDGYQANANIIVKNQLKLGPTTLLCCASGDGTIGQIVQALVITPGLSDNARKTPILPIWGGNANDLACMLNGSAKTGLKSIISTGKVIAVHPLECTMQSPRSDHKTHRIAACYAGFGATAFAARKLNKPSHRQSKLHSIPGGRFIQEVITVAGALLEAPQFKLKDGDDIRVIYERTFSKGSRMAKIKRLPVQLTDEMFYLNTLENKRLVSAIPRLIESTNKKVSEKFLRSSASFTVQEDSWAQFDGEPTLISTGTKVHVALSRRPFYALSTALDNSENTK